jgi:arylsulfate sulfotransferase
MNKSSILKIRYKPLWLSFVILLLVGACRKQEVIPDPTNPIVDLPNPSIQTDNFQLNPSGNCPLAGLYNVSSDQEIKIIYTIKGQDGEDLTLENTEYKANQEIAILGLYPDTENTVQIKIINKSGKSIEKTLRIQTEALPKIMPQSDNIKVNVLSKDEVAADYILALPVRTLGIFDSQGGYPVIIDKFGKVRWFVSFPMTNSFSMMQLKNNNWLVADQNTFREIDLLGRIVRVFNLKFPYHHDVTQLPNGNLIYLSNMPTAAPTEDDLIHIIDYQTGMVIDEIDIQPLLDPTRQQNPNSYDTRDWIHTNSIFYDEKDNSVIISGRHQSAVFKIDLATKKLKWILSDPELWPDRLQPYLLKPTSDMEYPYGQHSALLDSQDPSRLLLFDNGNFRSYNNPMPATQSYSMIQEFEINEQNKTITPTLNFGKSYGSELFAPYLGKVDYVDGHIFSCFGGIVKNAQGNAINFVDYDGRRQNGINQVRLIEIDRNKRVVLDISIKGSTKELKEEMNSFRSYRAYPFTFSNWNY